MNEALTSNTAKLTLTLKWQRILDPEMLTTPKKINSLRDKTNDSL